MSVTNDLLGMGYKKKYEQRFKVGGGLFEIGASSELPPNAHVLIHENNPRLAIWRPLMGAMAGCQFGLPSDLYDSPAAMDAVLRKFQLTHIVARAKSSR